MEGNESGEEQRHPDLIPDSVSPKCMHCAELEDQLYSMEQLSAVCRQELVTCREEKAVLATGLEEYRRKYEGLLEKYVEALALKQRGGSRESALRKGGRHHESVRTVPFQTLANSAQKWASHLRGSLDQPRVSAKSPRPKAVKSLEDKLREQVLRPFRDKSTRYSPM